MNAHKRLEDGRGQILLAELVGLLHNIGKLDPNFYAPPHTALRDHFCFIPDYRFDRFAKPLAQPSSRKPSVKLSAHAEQVIIQDLSKWKLNEETSRQDFDKALSSFGKWQVGDATDFRQKALDAAWTLVHFLKSNGPLFLCLAGDRQRSKLGIQSEVDRIQQEIVSKKAERASTLDSEKKLLGEEIGKLHGELSRLKTLLSQPITLHEEAQGQESRESTFRLISLTPNLEESKNEVWPLADLLTLFWDHFFFKPGNDDYQRTSALHPWLDGEYRTKIPALLVLSHGEVSGSEKSSYQVSPKLSSIRHASAFGYEFTSPPIWNFSIERAAVINAAAKAIAAPEAQRENFISVSNPILETGLGDTRWPDNEITLWDYASTIATLFKAVMAKIVLEEQIPSVADVRWRFLSIRYNGLDYLRRAHHVSDLLARRKVLEAALDAVKVLIEVDCPLGNEVYRDENGSVLVVPHISVDEAEDVLKLPAVEGLDSPKLEQELRRRFAAEGKEPLAGELVPMVSLSGEVRGKGLRLTSVKPWQPTSFADPVEIDRIWEEEEKRGEICTVCGVRPQGYGASRLSWEGHLQKGYEHRPGEFPKTCQVCKAQSRSICHVCMERRDERSEDWATKTEEFRKTIWVDEVADSDGRLALVVGRFELDGWLSGQLIPTMKKDDSFARVRRCWETTRKFWGDVEQKLPELVGGYTRGRLVLKPAMPLALGSYHAYDLEINGRYLSVVFAPNSVAGVKDCLLTADNLDYARKLLAIGELRAYLTRKSFPLHEPSGHGNQQRRVTVNIDDAQPVAEELRYAPAITILSEPALYLALVPADRALHVARHIKEKYELEMARVRDRLPLQVGLVFAPRRTPMRALLESGQRMLKLPLDRWERWQVTPAGGALSGQGCQRLTFDSGVTWEVPVRMGDYQDATAPGTADDWYPHFVTEKPQTGVDLKLKHARDLTNGDEVLVRPSRFDFEFLDTAGRRLGISYNADGKRRGLPTRPFLLEKLGEFDELWRALTGGARKLGKSQMQNFEGALIERVAAWHGGDLNGALRDEVFQQFAEDTLHRLDQVWWNALQAKQKRALKRAARDGTLLDLFDLRMHILKEPRKENGA